MYFQKLESLKELNKKLTLVIDSLDLWLAHVPNLYRRKLQPELFAQNQDISVEVCSFLFNELVKSRILKERYVVECKCGHVLEFCDTLEDALDFVIDYNSEQLQCSSCDEKHELSTDDIFIIYELVEKPQAAEMIKKKNSAMLEIDDSVERQNLSERVLADPQKYEQPNIVEKLLKVAPETVRKKFLFLEE